MFLCDHKWHKLRNPAKRICEKCGEEQWLFENRPWLDRPRYEWKRMRGPTNWRVMFSEEIREIILNPSRIWIRIQNWIFMIRYKGKEK